MAECQNKVVFMKFRLTYKIYKYMKIVKVYIIFYITVCGSVTSLLPLPIIEGEGDGHIFEGNHK